MPNYQVNGFRRARYAAKMTQAEVARKLRVNPITIIQWEKGTNTPNRGNLERAAELFGCTEGELLDNKNASAG